MDVILMFWRCINQRSCNVVLTLFACWVIIKKCPKKPRGYQKIQDNSRTGQRTNFMKFPGHSRNRGHTTSYLLSTETFFFLFGKHKQADRFRIASLNQYSTNHQKWTKEERKRMEAWIKTGLKQTRKREKKDH